MPEKGIFDNAECVEEIAPCESKPMGCVEFTEIRKETAKSIAKDLMQKVVFLAEGRFIPIGCVENILERYTK